MHWIDFLLISFFIIGFPLYGYLQRKRNKTIEDYFLGGRNIPWYVAILGGFPAAAGAVVVTEVLEDGINQITETKYGISGSADNLIVETRQ